VLLDDKVPEVRPGFTCTADITTATRQAVVSVPIPAVAVRELVYDANGQVIKEPKTDKRRRPSAVETAVSAQELKPGQTRKETEGVFVVRDGKAEFLPIKMGVAGDKYFEVLSGLKGGDQVITGPYNSVRGMADGISSRSTTTRRSRRASTEPSVSRMNKFLDSAAIALDAIWSSKLRSFMTVLGNIVAVTSIIAVVSLIQGLNASVKQAILNQAAPTRSTSSSFRSRAATRSSRRSARIHASRSPTPAPSSATATSRAR